MKQMKKKKKKSKVAWFPLLSLQRIQFLLISVELEFGFRHTKNLLGVLFFKSNKDMHKL